MPSLSLLNVNFPENLDISPSEYTINDLRPSKNNQIGYTVFGDVAQRKAIHKYGIAGRVWEAAYFLSKYVDPQSNLEFDPPFIGSLDLRRNLAILELGSGAGLTSCRIAEILTNQDILIATDLPEVCSLLESNVKASTASTTSSVYVRPLAWGDHLHAIALASELLRDTEGPTSLTHVVCSDLIYFPELLAPLLRTLLQVTSPPFSLPGSNSGVTVVISYKLRSLSKESPFWSAFGLWFNFEPVLARDSSSANSNWQRFGASLDDTAFIFVGHRRPESLSWTVPAGDSDLLDGRGAMGNNSAKGDDTFETLLFMSMDDISL